MNTLTTVNVMVFMAFSFSQNVLAQTILPIWQIQELNKIIAFTDSLSTILLESREKLSIESKTERFQKIDSLSNAIFVSRKKHEFSIDLTGRVHLDTVLILLFFQETNQPVKMVYDTSKNRGPNMLLYDLRIEDGLDIDVYGEGLYHQNDYTLEYQDSTKAISLIFAPYSSLSYEYDNGDKDTLPNRGFIYRVKWDIYGKSTGIGLIKYALLYRNQ